MVLEACSLVATCQEQVRDLLNAEGRLKTTKAGNPSISVVYVFFLRYVVSFELGLSFWFHFCLQCFERSLKVPFRRTNLEHQVDPSR